MKKLYLSRNLNTEYEFTTAKRKCSKERRWMCKYAKAQLLEGAWSVSESKGSVKENQNCIYKIEHHRGQV